MTRSQESLMQRSLRVLAVTLAFVLVSGSATAQGGPTPPEQRSAEASAHFERGTTFYREGDYAAALIEFKRAYDLSPSWQVLFNIGQSYFQLHDYPNALLTLQRFAREGGDRIEAEDRTTIENELPDLANRVGRVSIVSNLEGATVTVDDQVIGATPLVDPVLVGMGIRKFMATHEGRMPVEQRVAIGGGDTLALRLDFAALVSSGPSKARLSSEPRSVRVSVNYLPTYLALLVGSAGVAGGSIFGVMAIADKSNLDRVCTGNGACPASSQPDVRALTRDSIVSTVGFGVAAAGLVAGIALWMTATPSSSTTASSPRFGPGLVAGSF
jgi:hypothetical protein